MYNEPGQVCHFVDVCKEEEEKEEEEGTTINPLIVIENRVPIPENGKIL